MKIDRKTVEHIAELAKLQLSDEEVNVYVGQLSDILDYAERLQALDTDAIPPTASVLPLSNVLRADEVGESLPRNVALSNAAEIADGQFKVDAILEDDV